MLKVQPTDDLVYFRLCDRQCGKKADSSSCDVQKGRVFEGLFSDLRRIFRGDADHKAFSPHLIRPGKGTQLFAEILALPGDIFEQLGSQMLKNCLSRREGDGVGGEGGAVIPRGEGGPAGKERRPEGQSAAEPLPQSDDVRLEAKVFKGKEFSGSAQPSLNFVRSD